METNYDEIYKKIWDLAPHAHNGDTYQKLNRLTQQLIHIYDGQGRLSDDPFAPTRERLLSQPFEKLYAILKNSVCVVTGGLGCVGSNLTNELLKFAPKHIVVLDKNQNSKYEVENDPCVTILHGDVRDSQFVHDTFTKYRPEYVFHTAAQRDPGYAETHIEETVTTNVLGTLNLAKASEYTGSVKQFVFSSTGKASRYFTEEVYAGTKKVCENILDLYARNGRVKYGMVRFTHMLDNSIMNDQIKTSSEHENYVGVHSPGKYVTAQNNKEAATLMLSALLYSQPGQCNFLIVRNLEWPVESLEMALYYIKKFGREIPVVFVGNPSGYTEKFFRGQMDWSRPGELNLLINAYENKFRKLNAEGDIVISKICQASQKVIEKALCKIEKTRGESELKSCLIDGLKVIVKDTLSTVKKEETVNILNWGLQKKFLDIEKAKVSDYGAIIPMMFESLEGTAYYEQVSDLRT
jgi:nucleoside-diphosphate-sugar epimerase